MKTAACSGCGRPIIWAVTERGKSMPVDATPLTEPTAGGNVVLEEASDPREPPLATVLKKSEVYTGPRHTSHFATCPRAGEFRRAR